MALEDTTFLDVFTVGFSDESFQQFLEITDATDNEKLFSAEFIDIKEANTAQHLLDKVCKEVKIDN